MKHRILSLLLAVVMVLVLLPVGAAAVDEESIIEYQGLSFNKVTGVVLKCTMNSSSIVIPGQIEGKTVVEIADRAFVGATMTSVTIPNTVWKIGDSAFDGCTTLKTLIIQGGGSENLEIGQRAFASTGITGLVLPSRVTAIGDYAFMNNDSLVTAVVRTGITSFGEDVFSDCNGLRNVVIPGMSYNANPFFDCPLLTIIHYLGGTEPTIPKLSSNIELHPAAILSSGDNTPVDRCFQDGRNPETVYCRNDDSCNLRVDATYTVTAEPHQLVEVAEKVATCTENGSSGEQKCTVCGQTIVQPTITPATGHRYVVDTAKGVDGYEIKDSTCSETGLKTTYWKCDNPGCDDAYAEEEIIELKVDHNYTSGKTVEVGKGYTIEAATCEKEGQEIALRICDDCGKTEIISDEHLKESHGENDSCDVHITRTVPKLEHQKGTDWILDPDADDQNYNCAEGSGDKEIAVLYQCQLCKEFVISEKIKIPAGEHIYGEPEKLDESVDPTCEEDGKLITQRTCTVCGYKENPVEEVLPATGHKVTEWKITVPATCTKEGEREGKCESCDKIITEKIAPLGHDFESDLVTEEVIKEATCTEEGLKYLICGREECDGIDNKKEVVIPMAPHTPTPPAAGTVLKEATCTDEGSIVYNTVCAVCGTDLQNTPIATPALGHDFGAWTTSGGVRTRTCQREGCGYTETDASTTPSTPSDPSTPSTPSTSTSYAVDVIRPANGTITVSTSSAKPGTTVSVTLRPNSGYQLDSVQVTRGGSGTVVSLTGGGSNRYTFTMPAARVEVRAVFSTVSSTSTNTTAPTTSTSTPTKNIVINIPQVASASTPAGSLVFVDVPSIHWASGEIAWACQRGFFSGSGGNFYPDNLITVRQMWMVMARMMNQNPASMEEARVWALNNGFASGANPNASVTRLQMATMLYRLARLMGSKNTNTTNLGVYTDSRNIPDASKNAVAWAVANGIITGTTETRLDPNVSISRAQACVILYRYYQRLF